VGLHTNNFFVNMEVSSLRIFHVVEASGSGTSRHVLDLTKDLVRCGHETIIFVSTTHLKFQSQVTCMSKNIKANTVNLRNYFG